MNIDIQVPKIFFYTTAKEVIYVWNSESSKVKLDAKKISVGIFGLLQIFQVYAIKISVGIFKLLQIFQVDAIKISVEIFKLLQIFQVDAIYFSGRC